MPAQTSTVQTKFYTQWDSAPDLTDTLYELDGETPIDLTGSQVYFIMAFALGNTYFNKRDPIIDHELATVVGDATLGNVAWTPSDDSLSVPGFFDFQWIIVQANSKQRSVLPSTYKHVRVQAPPGGRLTEAWSP